MVGDEQRAGVVGLMSGTGKPWCVDPRQVLIRVTLAMSGTVVRE
jgi:hypothetical protein